jgi:hypothetical protein
MLEATRDDTATAPLQISHDGESSQQQSTTKAENAWLQQSEYITELQ